MSIGKDPLFRDQYAGGGDYTDDVAAALSGRLPETETTEKPKQPVRHPLGEPSMFGPPVKLR